MGKSKIDKKAKTINLKGNSKKEFFLLHGFTGSPTDFNHLGEYLNKRFDANVRIIRLKGHGEKIENLSNFEYNDLFLQAENELKKDLKKGREIIVGGISLGSFIALQLSTKYPVKGIINISIPYKYKFLISIVAFFEPFIKKKHWKKVMPESQKALRKDAFYYDASLFGFRYIKEGKDELDKILNKVIAPCLIVHVMKEKVFHLAGAKMIQNRISDILNFIKLFRSYNYSFFLIKFF